MTAIAVLGGSRSHEPFIEAIRERGHEAIVFDRDGDASGKEHASEFHAVSTHDTEKVLEILEGADVGGCFTYSSYEGALRTVAAVNERFGLRGLAVDALDRMWAKPDMLKALDEAGVAVPDWIVGTDPTELDAMVGRYGRVVVKPARGGVGSSGVSVVGADSEDTSELFDRAAEVSSDDRVLIERHLDGHEYGVDGFVAGGAPTVLAVSRKYSLPDRPVMSGFAAGAGAVAPEVRDRLHMLAPAAIGAALLDDSFFSLDVIESGGRLHVIDAGPLLDAKVDRLLHHAGVDVYGLPADLVTGAAPAATSLDGGAALRFLYAATRGTISVASPGPVEGAILELERDTGDDVHPPDSVADVLGWVVATGDDGFDVWTSLLALDLTGHLEVAE